VRALASFSLVLMLASAPAYAGGAPIPTSESAPQRTGPFRGVRNFLAKHFTSRAEVKQAAALSQALRNKGDLVGSAKALTSAPEAQNLFERFRLYRQNQALFKDARSNLNVDTVDSNPEAGKAALKVLGAAGKLGFFKKWSAGVALVRSGGNAQKAARKLGNDGRFDDALSLLKYSRQEKGPENRAAMRLSDRLYGQAMKSSERAVKVYQKAVKHGDGEQAQAAYKAALGGLDLAAQFGGIRDTAPHSRPTFQENRARMIAAHLGTSLEKIDAELANRAEAQEAQQAANKPVDNKSGLAEKLEAGVKKQEQTSPLTHAGANGELAINPS